MRSTVLISLFCSLLLSARENPFVPPQANTHKTSVSQTVTVHSSKKRKPKIHPQRLTRENHVTNQYSHTSALTDKIVFNTLKARFIVRNESVYIETKDTLKKYFALEHPSRIVMDFKSASDFASKRKKLKGFAVTQIEVGAHGSYYRVVFKLDSTYKYKVKKVKYGFLLSFQKEVSH